MKRRLWIGLAVVLLLAALGWAGARRAAAPSSPVAEPVTARAPVEFVEADLETLVPGSLSRTVPLTGTLRPVEQTVIKTKVPGELRELVVREGMPVRRGQVVARLDPIEYEVRVREREATLRAAVSQVDQAKRTLDNTAQLKERAFVSQSALDQARSAWEVAQGNRDAAQAQWALARKQLADTVLTSPIDGVVAERFAQGGEKLPVDGRVVSIINLDQMEIEAPLPAAEIGTVAVGAQVTLNIEGLTAPQKGRIERIAPGTQAGTRSVPVYIRLDNRGALLRAGLFAQGSLAVETRRDVLSVPQSAIRDQSGRTFVYAVVDGRLAEKDVVLGLRDDSHSIPRVQVLSGLAAGDRIVAANLGTLRVGAPVRVVATPVSEANPQRAAAPRDAAAR